MKKTYRYEIVVYVNRVKVKRFLGNDLNEMKERYEMWLIKQSYSDDDLWVYTGEVQHANY